MKKLLTLVVWIMFTAIFAIPRSLLFALRWFADMGRFYAYYFSKVWLYGNRQALLFRTILAERAVAKATRRINGVEELIFNNNPWPHGFGFVRLVRLNATLSWVRYSLSELRVGLKCNVPLKLIFARFLCDLPEMAPDLDDRIKATRNGKESSDNTDYIFHTQFPEIELLTRCLESKDLTDNQREEFLLIAREIISKHSGLIFADFETFINTQSQGAK